MQQFQPFAHVPQSFAVEEVQATLPGCTQEFFQIMPGKLDYRLTRLEYPNLRLFRERTNKTLLKRAAQGGDLLFFSLPARSEGACRVAGHAFAHHVGLMTDARQPMELITPASMELLYLVFDRRWFALHAIQQGLPGLTERLRGQAAFALPQDGLARFVARLPRAREREPHDFAVALDEAVEHLPDAPGKSRCARTFAHGPFEVRRQLALIDDMRDKPGRLRTGTAERNLHENS